MRVRCRVPVAIVVVLAVVLVGCGQGEGRARPLGVVRLDRSEPVARVEVPLSPRADALVAVAGADILVLGGEEPGFEDPDGGLDEFRSLADGARYEVGSGRWWPISPIPAGPLYFPVGIWTGEELVVVGSPCGPGSGWSEERDEDVCRPGGLWVGAYRPRDDRWRPLALPAGFEDRETKGRAVDVVALGRRGQEAVFRMGRLLLLVDPAAGTSRGVAIPEDREAQERHNTRLTRPCVQGEHLVSVDGISNSAPPLPVTLQAPLRVLRLDPEGGGWAEIQAIPRPVTDRLDTEIVACGGGEGALVYLPVLRQPGPALGEGVLWWQPGAGRWEAVPPVPIDPQIVFPHLQAAREVAGHKVLMLGGNQYTPTGVLSFEERFVLAPGAREWRRLPGPNPLPEGGGSAGIAAGWMVSTKLTVAEPRPGAPDPAGHLTLVNVDHLIGLHTPNPPPGG